MGLNKKKHYGFPSWYIMHILYFARPFNWMCNGFEYANKKRNFTLKMSLFLLNFPLLISFLSPKNNSRFGLFTHSCWRWNMNPKWLHSNKKISLDFKCNVLRHVQAALQINLVGFISQEKWFTGSGVCSTFFVKCL